MSQAEDKAGVLHQADQCFGFGDGVGHRLVTDHVKAVFQRRFGEGKMRVVGGHDRRHLGAVLACGFGCAHLGDIGMDPIFRQAEFPAGAHGLFRIGGQDGAYHLVAVVKPGCLAVHGTDERTRATAHQGETPAELFKRIKGFFGND